MDIIDRARELVQSATGSTDPEEGPEEPDEENSEEQESDVDEVPDESSGGFFGGDDDDSEPARKDRVEDLEYELEELRDELEQTDSSIRTIESKQDNVEDQVEQANDRIRGLLGVYDKIVDGVNPFSDEASDDVEQRFGVVGGNTVPEEEAGKATETSTTDSDKSTEETESTSTEEAASKSKNEQNSLTVDDLDEGVESNDDGPDTTDATHTHEQQGNQTLTPEEAMQDDDTFLTLPPDAYPADLVMFEWLSFLMNTAGETGTLKAVSYYAEIGWISPQVRRYLETVVSGPKLEIDVDTCTPDELSTTEHKRSFEYIMTLQEIKE